MSISQLELVGGDVHRDALSQLTNERRVKEHCCDHESALVLHFLFELDLLLRIFRRDGVSCPSQQDTISSGES